MPSPLMGSAFGVSLPIRAISAVIGKAGPAVTGTGAEAAADQSLGLWADFELVLEVYADSIISDDKGSIPVLCNGVLPIVFPIGRIVRRDQV